MNDEIVHYRPPTVITRSSDSVCRISESVNVFRVSSNPRDITCVNCMRTDTFRHAHTRQANMSRLGGRHDQWHDTSRTLYASAKEQGK